MPPSSLQCLPMGLCSWNFRVQCGDQGQAEVYSRTFSEQGSIALAGRQLTIQKHGWASGLWTLEHDGDEVASAHKPSAFGYRFELHAGGQGYELKRAGWATRTFHLYQGPTLAAVIEPQHALTRRTTIKLPAAPPLPVVLFAFWLAVMIWRRNAQSSSS